MGEQTGWLIEHDDQNPQPKWFAVRKCQGDAAARMEWVTDSNQALRFARKVDAVDFTWLYPDFFAHGLITEHIWVSQDGGDSDG